MINLNNYHWNSDVLIFKKKKKGRKMAEHIHSKDFLNSLLEA